VDADVKGSGDAVQVRDGDQLLATDAAVDPHLVFAKPAREVGLVELAPPHPRPDLGGH
jgi:hypothetical protein